MVGERLMFGPGGWIRYVNRAAPVRILLRFAPGEGGLACAELYLDGSPVTSDLLRLIPVERITRWVNAPGFRERVFARLGEEVRDLDALVAAFREGIGYEPPAPSLEELRVPERRPYPPSFYAQVALATLAGRTAREIAEAAGVPRTTAERWVKEARARGLLPRSRRGRR